MSNKILIIGALGYTGSVLTPYLKEIYETVDTLSLRCYGDVTYNMNIEDITNDIIQKYDIIILLAGNPGIPSCGELLSTFENNVSNFIHILNLIDTQKFIYASSCGVYGDTKGKVVNENEPLSTISFNYYDVSKKTIDMFAIVSGKEVYGLRCGTICGYSPNFRTDLIINKMVLDAKNTGLIDCYSGKTHRAILGMNDFVRVVHSIIQNNNKDNRGIYNIASFNNNVMDIALDVSCCMDSYVSFSHSKSVSQYDFQIDCDSFCKKFKFEFHDTIESIVNDIVSQWDNIKFRKDRTVDFYKEYQWNVIEKKECRVCDSPLVTILDFGNQPLANDFHQKDHILDTYPLCLKVCTTCFHLQLSHVVNPIILFRDYIYVSGTSKTGMEFFEWFVNHVEEFVPKGVVVDIACNDGSQLDIFKANGWTTIGVDPADNLYPISSGKGHTIYNEYWNAQVASNILEQCEQVSLIVAQNVFAHTDDIHSFLRNCSTIMDDHTTLIIQTSQSDMIIENQCDTIYHEHVSFFSIHSMDVAVHRNGMHLNNIERHPIHGNSFIFTISKAKSTDGNAIKELSREALNGLHSVKLYHRYATKCRESVEMLIYNIALHIDHGYKIIGYGASAKGNTILNYGNIRNIKYIVDDNPLKWELYTPGTDIPIKAPDILNTEVDTPLCVVMLTWNFGEEIKRKISQYNIKNVTYLYF